MITQETLMLPEAREAFALLEQMAAVGGSLDVSMGREGVGHQGPLSNARASGRDKGWRPDLRYRSLIEKLPVVTFMAGLDDSVQELYVSPQIETLLGFTPAAWLENPFLWFRQLHPDDRDVWVRDFAMTCANGSNFRSEYRLIAKDGHVVWVQGECQIICDNSGKPMLLQGIAVDITHRKHAEKVEEARLAAEAANSAKSEFLARMSHEIRTPLNGVVGMIDLLRSTELNSNQQRYATLARDSADALMKVINDILDFSKIEAGKVEMESLEFDLRALVADLTELLAPLAAKKKLALTCRVDPDFPAQVVGDPNRLRQVLTNLVNNALKFTTSGSITIDAAIQHRAANGMTVRIAVKDTGIGIPADRRDRLFQSFSQVDSSTSRKFGGTGLGLAISKRLVELMGGEIGFESAEGHGTTFSFTIHVGTCAATSGVADNEAKSAPAAAAPAGPAALQGLHLLVAEDNEMNQFVIQETLRRMGCTCDVVGDGALAVEAVQQREYNAVLMDCQMPRMDGLEAARRIRERETATPGARMPIIALTAEAIQGDREKCLAAGMDGYVSKPIDADKLFATIAAIARRPRPIEAAAEPAAPPIDVPALLLRCMSDAEFAVETLQQFHERAIGEVDMLRRELAAGDADNIKRLAHNFQAVAAHVSAGALRALAIGIEEAGARRDFDFVARELSGLDEEAKRCAAFVPVAIRQLCDGAVQKGAACKP
jgi:PAS domain S-box-containing protein